VRDGEADIPEGVETRGGCVEDAFDDGAGVHVRERRPAQPRRDEEGSGVWKGQGRRVVGGSRVCMMS